MAGGRTSQASLYTIYQSNEQARRLLAEKRP
jgi:hypothetical protein